MQAKMAWALMQRCGLQVDAERFRATHDFVARGTNTIGYVWYKDGGKKNPSYADMGRTGASAMNPRNGATATRWTSPSRAVSAVTRNVPVASEKKMTTTRTASVATFRPA